MKMQAWSKAKLEACREFPPKTALICIFGESQAAAKCPSVAPRLNLPFEEVVIGSGWSWPVPVDYPRRILQFAQENAACENLIVQDLNGACHSHSITAAFAHINGIDNRSILRHGTYDPLLYKRLMEEAGVWFEGPLVSVVVRVQYPVDRLQAFVLSMQRQRWENWELIVVRDPSTEAAALEAFLATEPRIRSLLTNEPQRRWGHSHRRQGIGACNGLFVGLQNDDNYLTPGYVEQLAYALEGGADVAMCQVAHSYSGWSVTAPGTDLGSWMARRELLRQVPWDGEEFDSDAQYLHKLTSLRGVRQARIFRPLFVHN